MLKRADPISYPGLTREVELELIRAYREDGDLDALERLVGAHRPMVVTMAQYFRRGNGTSLKALVEYGLWGVRLAAEPPRPSKTKKGAMVGFDPSLGHRFSTYARHDANKEMQKALGDVPWEPSPDYNSEPNLALAASKAAEEMVEWHTAPSLRGIIDWNPSADECEWHESWWCATYDASPIVIALMERKPYFKCYRPWTLWNPTEPSRKARPRNFIQHPRTKTELANRKASYDRSVLATWEDLAECGQEGWRADGKADFDLLVANYHGSRHVLKRKNYRVPKKFMRFWWRLGKKRLRAKIKFSTNKGLGVCNRYGNRLPDYNI
jgi:hypothetical protein